MGLDARAARRRRIDELVEALASRSTRDAHIVASAELPRFGAEAVGPLSDALARPALGPGGVAWIAEALGKIGPAAAPAVPVLGRRLMEGGRLVAVIAAALGRIGKASAVYLGKGLTHEDLATRVYAGQALVTLGADAGSAADQLLEALGDVDPVVRTYAAQALGAVPTVRARSVPALLDVSHDEDASTRYAAVVALGRIAAADPLVQRRLMDIVRHDEDDDTRVEALGRLDHVLGRDQAALAFLRDVLALGDPSAAEDERLHVTARDMLLARGVDEPALVEAVADAPPEESFRGLLRRGRLLTRAGPNGRRAALPLLVRVLDWGPAVDMRVAAATLLGGLGSTALSNKPTMEALEVHADERNEKAAVVAAARAALQRLRR